MGGETSTSKLLGPIIMIGQSETGSSSHITFITLFSGRCYAWLCPLPVSTNYAKMLCRNQNVLTFLRVIFVLQGHILSTGRIAPLLWSELLRALHCNRNSLNEKLLRWSPLTFLLTRQGLFPLEICNCGRAKIYRNVGNISCVRNFVQNLSGTYDLTKVDDKCHFVHLHNALHLPNAWPGELWDDCGHIAGQNQCNRKLLLRAKFVLRTTSWKKKTLTI
jgi:hypothetical protein